MSLPSKALSIRQPWPAFIFDLPPETWKDVENRDWDKSGVHWRKDFRGWVWVHASSTMTAKEWLEATTFAVETVGIPRADLPGLPDGKSLPMGCIIGAIEILDFVHSHPSDWFMGPGALVLGRRRLLPRPVPCVGALGWWTVKPETLEEIRQIVSKR